MILWGYASDSRKERIWHITLAALFTALGLIIAHLLVLLGLTIAIVGQFSALPVINTLLPSLLRGPALAGGIALYNTMAQFGGFFGPIVIGVLKQETNGYAAGLIALAVAVTSRPRPRAFAARRVRKHRPRIAKIASFAKCTWRPWRLVPFVVLIYFVNSLTGRMSPSFSPWTGIRVLRLLLTRSEPCDRATEGSR